MILSLWLRVSILFISCSIRVPLVSSLLSILAVANSRFFYYAYLQPGEWCVLSFDCRPALADRVLDTLLYNSVDGFFIPFQDYISRDYHYFIRFQIGSFIFDVASRDPIRPERFFKKFLRAHFVSAYNL